MQAKIIITIDTEPDNQWDSNLRKHPEFKNIEELGRLQRLFDKFYIKPVYLVTYSVVKSGAASVLKGIADSVNCEIGSHLHAWDTPPFMPPIKGLGTYLHQYDFGLQSQKMANLDNLITETFGHKPVSYRGGRWSFDKNTIAILAEHKYLVDSSVSPCISWENDGGINFKKFPNGDYFIKSEKNHDILEIPPSIEIKTGIPQAAKFLYLNMPDWSHAEGLLRRLVNFNIIWLDPSFNSYEDMKWLADNLLGKGIGYLNIMFHSSVIIPGGSPYTVTGENTERFFDRLERLLDYLISAKGLETMTLKEFYNYRKIN